VTCTLASPIKTLNEFLPSTDSLFQTLPTAGPPRHQCSVAAHGSLGVRQATQLTSRTTTTPGGSQVAPPSTMKLWVCCVHRLVVSQPRLPLGPPSQLDAFSCHRLGSAPTHSPIHHVPSPSSHWFDLSFLMLLWPHIAGGNRRPPRRHV
jgi:hypothetical protein